MQISFDWPVSSCWEEVGVANYHQLWEAGLLDSLVSAGEEGVGLLHFVVQKEEACFFLQWPALV